MHRSASTLTTTTQGSAWLSSPATGRRVRIVRSTQYDPFVNLALEEALFREHADDPAMRDAWTLYLWSNDPSVIIGRNQSAHRECRLQAMEEQRVNLVRRRSGGGAVYHDRGNAIFSFLSPEAGARAVNNATLVAALAKLGVHAEASGRNDIEVVLDTTPSRKKVSGAAFRYENDTLLHHGTMLLHVDMGALARLLNPDRLKLESKAIKSVSARVANVRDLVPGVDRASWEAALVRAFLEQHGFAHEAADPEHTHVQTIDHAAALAHHPVVRDRVAQSTSAEWRFGAEPSFDERLEHRFLWGGVDIRLGVQANRISRCTVYSDSLCTDTATVIEDALGGSGGLEYTPSAVQAALAEATRLCTAEHRVDAASQVADVAQWLQQQM